MFDPNAALIHWKIAGMPSGVLFTDILVQCTFTNAIVCANPGRRTCKSRIRSSQGANDVMQDAAIDGGTGTTSSVTVCVCPGGWRQLCLLSEGAAQLIIRILLRCLLIIRGAMTQWLFGRIQLLCAGSRRKQEAGTGCGN